jgi:hypothetical protein
MDLNRPTNELNITFCLRDVRFYIQTKRSCQLTLIGKFDESDYKHIINSHEPLLLAQVSSNHIAILILM